MALSLGVNEGTQITIDNLLLEVRKVFNSSDVLIDVDGVPHRITDKQRTEVLRNVFVSCGLSGSNEKVFFTRLAFEAPYEIKIYRVKNNAKIKQ